LYTKRSSFDLYLQTDHRERRLSHRRPTQSAALRTGCNQRKFHAGPRSRVRSITVLSDTFGVRTDSAAVSTVVDDQFVQNTPLNGRSFQSLIALAPGTVFVSSSQEGAGQFTTNGQRSDANYFTVDGVSANFGSASGCCLGQSIGGAVPGFTSGGGTNGLVSVDAMQEFRIQTSSVAPEFGHTPGAQISIVTKSGSNQFHGTAFDYVGNDIFDARNVFDTPPLPKPPLRQNDFGGTLGGPIRKDRTFFFFSYEQLRLLLPQTDSGAFLCLAGEDSARRIGARPRVWSNFTTRWKSVIPGSSPSVPTTCFCRMSTAMDRGSLDLFFRPGTKGSEGSRHRGIHRPRAQSDDPACHRPRTWSRYIQDLQRVLVFWPTDHRRTSARLTRCVGEMPSGLGHYYARTESRLRTR
jgi:hypothetical protein